MDKIYVISEHAETYHQLLEAAQLPDLAITSSAEKASIWLADPPLAAPLLPNAKALRWLQSTFAGTDALIQAPYRDYQLTNVRGIFGALMAEYVFGHILTETRHIGQYAKQQAQCHWQPQPYQSLRGKTLAILGTGAIGQHIATVAHAFGMTVVGVNQVGRPVEAFDQTMTLSELQQTLGKVDVLVSTLPATPETDKCLNTVFWQQAQNLLFINVGRGATVDEPALIHALDDEKLGLAVLDVMQQEPLPEQHPFWTHPNVKVTPHIAAVSFPEQVFALFADNYHRWHAGDPLMYQVDFDKGY
ncbi:D-2-hydroxyacid dehydrogenase [Salinivibrio siamensis]|uniref:D-2-hydroxyacid dehydrogenase n=2 Tax=Salinivibrio TaxID=51366 RepID=A0AA47KKI4_9GAMM|nr:MULTISPECIES: D-2-hydroxyacid dehydrogenase [Salinivibrio]OOE82129.1 D-2-hydroxyacid dehydrogenase [Salinivibrio siamensis]WBA08512.1 D-2-hydroxyacid dehydrogenase [Salinivibrio kushneri]